MRGSGSLWPEKFPEDFTQGDLPSGDLTTVYRLA